MESDFFSRRLQGSFEDVWTHPPDGILFYTAFAIFSAPKRGGPPPYSAAYNYCSKCGIFQDVIIYNSKANLKFLHRIETRNSYKLTLINNILLKRIESQNISIKLKIQSGRSHSILTDCLVPGVLLLGSAPFTCRCGTDANPTMYPCAPCFPALPDRPIGASGRGRLNGIFFKIVFWTISNWNTKKLPFFFLSILYSQWNRRIWEEK